jgi:hypothetical protein
LLCQHQSADVCRRQLQDRALEPLKACFCNRDSLSLLPMPVTLPFRAVFAAPAVTLACSALLTLFKSVLRSECPAPGGSKLRPVAIACMVAVVLCLVASAAYLVKSRVWTHAATICSKWQPVFFVIVSVQRLILTAIVTYTVSAGSGHIDSCSEYESAVRAISLMWNCAVLMTALSTMCCDTAADLSPRLRRCAYGLLALVLFLDAIGSVVWGNPLASDASFSVTANSELFEHFSIVLDNQLTSSVASQVVLTLHFVYVAWLSRRGRGWAYASLRFELDERGRSTSVSMVPTMTSSRMDSGLRFSAVTPMLALDASAPAELQHAGAARWNALSRLRLRWLQFRQRQVSRCRVFVVPCVAMLDAGGGGKAEFALARPAFDFRWLQPLQRLADVHPRFYVGFIVFFLAVPSFACSFTLGQEASGISNTFLNFCMCIMAFGGLSSKRIGLDRIAVKHVALSFRFSFLVTMLAAKIALFIRGAYQNGAHPATVVASALVVLLFCLCILLDCSPHLPPIVQIFVSVNDHSIAYQKGCLLSTFAGYMVHTLRIWRICCFSTFKHWP